MSDTPTGEPEENEKPFASDTPLILAAELLPDNLPILAIRPRPLFPGIPVPLEVGAEQAPSVKHAVDFCAKTIGIVLVKDPEGNEHPDNLHQVGVAAKILKVFPGEGDSASILINCLDRFRVKEYKKAKFGTLAHVEYPPAAAPTITEELRAYGMAVLTTLKELVKMNPLQSEAIKMFLSRSTFDDPGRLADFAANLTTASGEELQGVLETFDVRERINKVLVLLKREVEISRLHGEINRQIHEKISGQQKEFFLKEQLKAIKKELGLEKEGKATEIEKFQERLKGLTLNAEAQKTVEDELEKFQLLEPHSPEYTVSRNYLDWLTALPWGKFSEDSYDLGRARKILDRDHYGLEDVKDRILEFIAVGKLKGDISGSILCLIGPPGVGKTSVGKSIADALGRTFYRFSLGGMRDEAEIKGHRRTYIGALPGKFLQAMKTAGTSNPLIMLDEIDKIGASFQGDPASALLEVLDPEQNNSFRDHYLDVPFDLSHVLFVATGNQLDTIPRPLLDRMEVIRLSGYITEEKREIARRYLIPKTLKSHGLKSSQIAIKPDALNHLIEDYAREAGVRNLENLIKKIARKAAMAIVKGGDAPAGKGGKAAGKGAPAAKAPAKIVLEKKDIEEYLGKPAFSADEVFESKPGVVTGLAWTSMGGATLQIEATAVQSKTKGFKQTGQLGAVMVESSDIAYSYVMAHLEEYGADPSYFEERFVHIHVPAGATPKDGPSAGVTMATALVSLVLGKPVRKHLAMTGELTLTGQVLPIGGVKEKVIAARRVRTKTLIFPEANRKDFEELPAYLKKGFSVHFAARFEDVFKVALGKSHGR
ncbi:MAG: endopeptidase La [Acidobacteriota bacterium]|jgi:ATP-dependent Lon protease|nr:endopeptidase La [Acidobacteriota bacterium]